jgi:hypothetical protein
VGSYGAVLALADVKGGGASGTAEKLAGKMTGDPGKQARGQERKVLYFHQNEFDCDTDAIVPRRAYIEAVLTSVTEC